MRISRLSAIFILFTLSSFPRPSLQASSPAPGVRPAAANAQAPADEEIRARTKTLLANQHADDEALELYERVERHIDRTGGANPRTLDDKTYRIVPTGVANQKTLLNKEGKPPDPAAYARQMHELEQELEMMANPDDRRAKAAYAKYQKRMRDRAGFVDAASDAYTGKWVGRENRNGRDCDVFALDPSPKFQPRPMFQEVFTPTTAKL